MIRFILALLNLLRLWKRVEPVDVHEQVTGPDASPPVRPPRPVRNARKSKELNATPWLRQPGETAQDWLERTTTNK